MNAQFFPPLFASLLLLSHNRTKCRSVCFVNVMAAQSSFHSINIIHLFFRCIRYRYQIFCNAIPDWFRRFGELQRRLFLTNGKLSE